MKTTVTIRIDADLKKEVSKMAKETGRTFSGIICMLLKKWTKENKNER
jgi:antitoxin component of RelBE/YafQ-DinJ toxin-antitoxin module